MAEFEEDKADDHSPDDSDDDYDLHQGSGAFLSSAGSAQVDSTMDDSYAFGELSQLSSDDEGLDDVEPQTQPSALQLPLTIPTNIPPHLQLPPLPDPPPFPPDHGHLVGMPMTQQMMQIQDEHDDFDELMQSHPMAISPPNAVSLGPENLDVVNFLRHWLCVRQEDVYHDVSRYQARRAILKLAQEDARRIRLEDLAGDECDFQGINWPSLKVTRTAARQRRKVTYINYVNREGSDGQIPLPHLRPDCNFYRFQGMSIKRDVRLLHFQLRNILGCSSRSRAFYPSLKAVREINPNDGSTKAAMTFESDSDAQTSTLTASQDVLIAGGFFGDFRYRSLNTEDATPTKGRLTDHPSGITNHVQIHEARRSHAPLAAFASNDYGFRVVDLGTNQHLSESMYECIINCSALSPDSRLRVMVGDHQDVFITDADSGRILKTLVGHSDFGFACDWAPDGWTVATGNQDRTVRIWDARYWDRPVAIIPTELSGARSLRFSPLGSGRRILAAAEEADYLNIIDAGTFQTKQTFDVFGEIGGISFTNGGSELLALCCDYYRGGLLQLSRCDHGAGDSFLYPTERHDGVYSSLISRSSDWLSEAELEGLGMAKTPTEHRRQAFLAYGDLMPF
ncbi:WD40-repeat-containing domain protein [Microdochium trichocladiopsis]|uniref:WD40-repeat-containing domain protein n=1 Tax=Microdochium trichocladiopsis TaxID=1682393 RepID=A0A9P8YCG1_9PEZI|nr:WD40-repeat-containing domain protein [Microdochium trichocladiopsis]KAH7035360.1 WD40-repeat-containing domain protein [Microdochium trichocladiopsis]